MRIKCAYTRKPSGDKRDAMIALNSRDYIVSLQDSRFINSLEYKQDFFMALGQIGCMLILEDKHQKYGKGKNQENQFKFAMAERFLRMIKEPGSY